MSSRTESVDGWPEPSCWTAERGPPGGLPAVGWARSSVTAGLRGLAAVGWLPPSVTAGAGPRPRRVPATASEALMARARGPAAEPPSDSRRPREADGWAIFSYMIGGMILYGGIGWLIGHWTGISVLFPVGMIVGLALAIVLIIYRVTRS